jgi:hypothetical protein
MSSQGWPPPERVWVHEQCVVDCVDRGWTEAKPGPDDNRFRSREYVRADVHDALIAEMQETIDDLEMALR